MDNVYETQVPGTPGKLVCVTDISGQAFYLYDALESMVGKDAARNVTTQPATYSQLRALKRVGSISDNTSRLRLVHVSIADTVIAEHISAQNVTPPIEQPQTVQPCRNDGREEPLPGKNSPQEEFNLAQECALQSPCLGKRKPDVDGRVAASSSTVAKVQKTSAPLHLQGKTYSLQMSSESYPESKAFLKKLSEFLTSKNDMDRTAPPSSHGTADKHLERIRCFLNVSYSRHPEVSDDVARCLNLTNITAYLDFLFTRRKLKESTVRNHLSSLIEIIKYCRAKCISLEVPHMELLEKLRYKTRLFNQNIVRHRDLALANGTASKFNWETLLDVLRQTIDKFEICTDIDVKCKLSQFLCIFLIQTMVCPTRIKELASLKIKEESTDDIQEGGNFLIRNAQGKLSIVFGNYKTVETYGQKRVDLWADDNHGIVQKHLINHLKLYRKRLLRGQLHNSLFVNSAGMPFASESSLSSYISKEYSALVGIPITSHTLRHAFWTWVFSNKDIEQNDYLVSSIARVLNHSVRTVRKYYNDQDPIELERNGLNFISGHTKRFLEDGHSSAVNYAFDTDGNVHDTDDAGALPVPGDICAFVEAASTAKKPLFILAKILRWNKSLTMVLVSQLSRNNDETDLCYEMQITASWWEPRDAIVWPLDIVYSPMKACYVLRTKPKCIHDRIKGK